MAEWRLVGNALSVSVAKPAVTALSANRIALADDQNDELRTYDFDGTNWVLVGTPLAVPSPNFVALATLSSTRIAYADLTQSQLRVYDFDGTNWTEVGTAFSKSMGRPAIVALSSSRIAFVDDTSDALHTFDFDGTNWTQVGNTTAISGLFSPSITSLSSTRVVVSHTNSDFLQVFDFDGTDWTEVPTSSVTSLSSPTVTALSSTRVALIETTTDSVRTYEFDGSGWTEVGTSLVFGSIGISDATLLGDNTIAMVDELDDLLRKLEFFQPSEMHITLADTTADIEGTAPPTGTLAASLGNTTADMEGSTFLVEGDIAATLGGTAATFSARHYVSGDISAALGGVEASASAFHGQRADVTEEAQAGLVGDFSWAAEFLLRGTATSPTTTFYNPQVEPLLAAVATLNAMVAYVEAINLQGTATLNADVRSAAIEWLIARAAGTLGLDLQLQFEGVLAALAGDDVVDAFAALATEIGQSSDSEEVAVALVMTDTMAAELIPQATLLISVEETLDAEAGDTVQVLGHYLQNVKDAAAAWLVFKVSGEVVQGWVMNLEGDRPFSEYSEFDFNSMTRIGSNYFAASDAGLHMLGGDTDDGEQIDASLSSMMLDFDTTAQKRVVAAYLGYTSDGTVVLKVRSVDDGKLVEHWYEAAEVTADAPRAGYRPLGRGLKSRYWQFELTNVDGSDFEIDKLELQPIKLSRRV